MSVAPPPVEKVIVDPLQRTGEDNLLRIPRDGLFGLGSAGRYGPRFGFCEPFDNLIDKKINPVC